MIFSRACVTALLASVPASFLFVVACSSSEKEQTQSTQQNDTAGDLAQAREVVAILTGPERMCTACHTARATDIKKWGASMQAVNTACFATTLSSADRVNCLRNDPTSATSKFSAHKLGFFAAGATLSDFSDLFEDAFSEATWRAAYATFQRQAKMPASGTPLSADDYAKLKAWVLRGMPQLDAAMASTDAGTDASTADAGNGRCRDFVSPELQAHITRMKTEGWGARLADRQTPMFGCGTAESAVNCLTTLPDMTDEIGNADVTQRLRKLRDLSFTTSFWARSSADGRYMGFGSSPSKIVDLTKPASTSDINVSASYDPAFFPSNDGFAYAGTNPGGIRVCKQSLLADVGTSPNPTITFSEAKCSGVASQVYESIGSALDGTRYFVTYGSHQNDNGGNSVTSPLPGGFGASASTNFVPMVNDGTAYKTQTTVNVPLADEGDMMLSPSSLLAASRFGKVEDGPQDGFRLHLLNVTTTGTTLSIAAPTSGEVCMKGGKPSMSFDERFLSAHQYVDHTEPDQFDLPTSSANIVMADLATGRKYRLTTMKAGQFALYPHFRADGWLYFLVRDTNTDKEYMAATDAALHL